MAGRRRALLIATDAYTDPSLAQLRAPTTDVEALTEVLADPAVGDFAVNRVINQRTEVVKREIDRFFKAQPTDLLVLYFSGHGVLAPGGRLFLATTDTELDLLSSSAIDEPFLQSVLERSRARSIVLLLDCCHSGAFGAGLKPKSAAVVDVEHRFEGEGRVILTASKALEYAFEEDDPQGTIGEVEASPSSSSLFTRYLVEGLKTGKADTNDDGRVSVDELYDYVFERVRARSTLQTPGRSGSRHGEIVIALNPHRASVPAEVRVAIDALTHAWPDMRRMAVAKLAAFQRGADPKLSAVIDEALRRALDDADPEVAGAVAAALRPRDASAPEPPREPAAPQPVALAFAPAIDAEIARHDEVVALYGDAAEPALRAQAAEALYAKGVRLGQLGRFQEEVAVFEQLAARYGDASEPAVRAPAEKALHHRAVTVEQLRGTVKGHAPKLARDNEASEPQVLQRVAESLYRKGVRPGVLAPSAEGLRVCDELIACYGDDDEPAARERVARALYRKAVDLRQRERLEEAVTVYDELVARHRDASEPALRAQVAQALVDAVGVSDRLIARYSDAGEPARRGWLPRVLLDKGVRLGQLRRFEDEIEVYDQLISLYAGSSAPAAREPVAMARYNRNIALERLAHRDA